MDFGKLASQVFHTYDIRGIYLKEITEGFAERLGLAWGTYVGKGCVCVGHDTRASSKPLCEALIRGILKTGCNVVYIGAGHSPLVYFYTMHKGLNAGCCITASHNPSEYNGFKFMKVDGSSYFDELDDLKKTFVDGYFNVGHGIREDAEAYPEYKQYWLSRISIQRPIRIVIDCFNAAASLYAKSLFESFGIDIVPIRDKVLPDFGGVQPEPTDASLSLLRKKVILNNADFGVGFDGDADRSVFVDNKGNVVLGGQMTAVFAKALLPRQPGAIVTTLDCQSAVDRVAREYGGTPIRCKVGHNVIENEVIRNHAVFGGEQSSHFFLGANYPFSDGLAVTLLLAQIVSESDSLSELIEEVKVNPTKKVYFDCGSHDTKNRVMEKLASQLKKEYPNYDLTDGVKVFLNDEEWALLRVSNTNPQINLCIEAKDESRLNELFGEFADKIKAYL